MASDKAKDLVVELMYILNDHVTLDNPDPLKIFPVFEAMAEKISETYEPVA